MYISIRINIILNMFMIITVLGNISIHTIIIISFTISITMSINTRKSISFQNNTLVISICISSIIVNASIKIKVNMTMIIFIRRDRHLCIT